MPERKPLKQIENVNSKTSSTTSFKSLMSQGTRRQSVSPSAKIASKRKTKSVVSTTRTKTAPKRTTSAIARTTVASRATSRTGRRSTKRKASSPPEGGRPSKRAKWDIKGRLEDAEGLIMKLKQELEESKENSEKERKELEEKIKDHERKYQDMVDETEREKKDFERKKEQLKGDFEYETERLKESHQRQIDLEKRSFNRRLENEKQNSKELQNQIDRLTEDLQGERLKYKAARDEITRAQQQFTESTTTTTQRLESQRLELEVMKKLSEDRLKKANELEKSLNEKIEQLEFMKKKELSDEHLRRQLHNQIQELKGNIRVFCRIRPLLPSDGCTTMEHVETDELNDRRDITLVKRGQVNAEGKERSPKKYHFEFDRIFNPESSQAEVFEEISQLVQSALDGYNVCIFAYGQTGSGKTHTMQGDVEGKPEMAGMIPRSVEKIFEAAQHLKDRGWEYEVSASFLEIYNENIRDLLSSKISKHEIKHADNRTTVTNLSYIPVHKPIQVYNLLSRAEKNRSVASTNCNERSSRSHSVFQLTISGKNESTDQTCFGTLNLIDLAGSERLKESKSEGDRLTETKYINSSLSTLAKVIQALGHKAKMEKKSGRHTSHVPFRDSKLTYLLQSALSGQSKVLMFANVNPSLEAMGETLCSLRFAAHVNNTEIGSAGRNMQ